MKAIKVIRGGNEIFTPDDGGKGYAYSINNQPNLIYTDKTWLQAVKVLKKQRSVRIIYDKPFNKEDWL